MRNKDYIGWTFAECKKCHKLFSFFDSKGEWNDEIPTKFYCPECQKAGFKNKKKSGRETPEEFLKTMCITDKIVRKEFKKIYKYRGRGRAYSSILKEAIEVADYKRIDK